MARATSLDKASLEIADTGQRDGRPCITPDRCRHTDQGQPEHGAEQSRPTSSPA